MLKARDWETENFFSLKALQGECVSFGDGRKGMFFCEGMIGKSMEHTIENVYYVNGWSTIF